MEISFGRLSQSKTIKIENKWSVMVEWEDNSIIWKSLFIIEKDDPVTITEYANKHELLDTPGWKRFSRLRRNKKNIKRISKQMRLNAMKRPRGKFFKFGVEIPKNYEDDKR